MNKLIKNQLEELKKKINFDFEESSLRIVLRKKEEIPIKEDNNYLIELSNELLDKNSFIASNWNKGKYPKYNYYIMDIKQIVGTMFKCFGVAYNCELQQNINNVDSLWEGWLPINKIKVLKKI